ncbi:hypothetical protein DL98DRAFT_523336, partial [Cadophora sp. DSE1049]
QAESTLDNNSSTLNNNSTTQAELIFDGDMAQTIDDLEAYDCDTFKRVSKEQRFKLRDDLRTYGVYVVKRKSIQMAQVLADIIQPPKIRIFRQTRSQLPEDSVSAETTISPQARNPSELYTGVPRLSSSILVHPSPLVLLTILSTGPLKLSTSRDPRSSYVKSLLVKSQPSLGKYLTLIRTLSKTKATSLRRALKKLIKQYSRARDKPQLSQ